MNTILVIIIIIIIIIIISSSSSSSSSSSNSSSSSSWRHSTTRFFVTVHCNKCGSGTRMAGRGQDQSINKQTNGNRQINQGNN